MVAAFSPDGSLLATSNGNGVSFWSSRTGHPAAPPIHISGGATSLAFSPSGRILAVAASDGVELWDLRSRTIIGAPLPGANHRLAFTSDGRTLVGTQYNGTGQATVWNITPTAWERQACRIAGRNLSPKEWRQFLPDRAYEQVCG